MDYDAFQRYVLDPLNVEPAEAHDWILRNRQFMKIYPTETNYNLDTVRKFTLENHNIDAMTLPSQSYIYCTATIEATVNNVTGRDHSLFTNGAADTYSAEDFCFSTTTTPASAGFIDGLQYSINGQTMDNDPSRLAASLYAKNKNKFSEDNKGNQVIGMAKPQNYLLNQKKSAGNIEFVIPLKYVVDMLSEDHVAYGYKQKIDITKGTLEDIFTLHNPNNKALLNGNDKITRFAIDNLVWMLPYVELQNEVLSRLEAKLYNTQMRRYWLQYENYLSDAYFNNQANTTTWRVASKSVNKLPRYLMVWATEAAPSTTVNNQFKPLGFVKYATNGTDETPGNTGALNNLCVSSLRVKLNNIYVDNDLYTDMVAPTVSANTDRPFAEHRFYQNGFIEYCKFYDKIDSEKSTDISFEEWLQEQVYVFDLNQIDRTRIYGLSGNSITIEIEAKTNKGSTSANKFNWNCIVVSDKAVVIQNSQNTATITEV